VTRRGPGTRTSRCLGRTKKGSSTRYPPTLVVTSRIHLPAHATRLAVALREGQGSRCFTTTTREERALLSGLQRGPTSRREATSE
jgi:hypothetical protein